jgi:hypothetical protein
MPKVWPKLRASTRTFSYDTFNKNYLNKATSLSKIYNHDRYQDPIISGINGIPTVVMVLIKESNGIVPLDALCSYQILFKFVYWFRSKGRKHTVGGSDVIP